MLTIHPVINRNYQVMTSFGESKKAEDSEQEKEQILIEEYTEYAEERAKWNSRRSDMQGMVDDKDAPVVKPMKKALQYGIVGSAAALGALGTGYSAKYIIERGEDVVKSKPFRKLVAGFKKKVSTPLSEGYDKVKEFIGKQFTKIKQSETYKNNKTKLNNQKEKFKKTAFAEFFANTAKKISNNKYVQKVVGFVDGIFSGIGEGVVKLYNKLTKANYKNTVSNTLGAAGGISTGAATMMEQKEAAEKEKAEKAAKLNGEEAFAEEE